MHTFSPKAFIEDYMPSAHRQKFENHLRERHVTLQQFTVDTSEIVGHLKRKTYYTSKGASVTIPEKAADLEVVIDEHQISVLDRVEKVDTK
jgi:hypothetical protein